MLSTWVIDPLTLDVSTPNPYTKLATMVIGGGDFKEEKIVERSEARTMELEGKWHKHALSEGDRAHFEKAIVDVDFPDISDIPTGMVCSFCFSPVDESSVTRGITKPRKIRKMEIIYVGGEKHVQEKLYHIPAKVMACKACVLEIKPVVNRDGDIISQGVKFLETEG